MRVTDSMMFDLAARNMQSARSRMSQAQDRASGKPISLSKDPGAVARAQRESMRAEKAQGHERVINTATAALMLADGALDDMGEQLVRARELAMMASNDTMNAVDRAAASVEVGRLREQLLALGNTRGSDGYIFGGYKGDSAPIDSTGRYVSDTNVREVEVAAGLKLPTTVSGSKVFGSGGAGVDVLATVEALRTALAVNDRTGISRSLDDLDRSIVQVSSSRAEVGAALDAHSVAGAVAQRTRDAAVALQMDLTTADPLEAYSELALAEHALNAAVQIAARLPVMSLSSSQR